MRLKSKYLVAFSTALTTLGIVHAYPQLTTATFENVLQARDYVAPDALASSYDFVIVGGGLAGLVLAARLTENSSDNSTVLVLEAGDSGDAVADRVDRPARAYYSSLLYTPYDWQFKTVPQLNAGNRTFDWPRGKVLGGSTAVNAMYVVRPSQAEIDAWKDLIVAEDSYAAKNWGWDSFYTAMKKSETFTPPRPESDLGIHIEWKSENYGTTGPMQVSYPALVGHPFFSEMSQVGDWPQAFGSLGIPTLTEPNGGKTLGALLGPSWINPTNWTRSYSKSAYLDPALGRPNLAVMVNSTVARLIFAEDNTSASGDGKLIVSGVEFVDTNAGRTGDDSKRRIINVNKEVILSGGVIGSPQILMLSGVGPKDVLEAAGVPVRVELPGVGQHLQDHVTAAVAWDSTDETAGDIQASNSDFSRTPEFLSYINSATAFVNLTRLFASSSTPVSSFRSTVSNSILSYAQRVVPSKYAEVTEGYKAIYDMIANRFMAGDEVAMVEFLLGTNEPQKISVQAALQHPLSQGRLYINSTSPFESPIIDPQYFSHPADFTIMREGIKLVRSLKNIAPFNRTLGNETFPGPGVDNSDEQLGNWLLNAISSQYHPISTCAMLPKAKGGVVDANLRVYGLANVRVVDASVYPFEFAAHAGASTYGLAEQASALILSQNHLKTTSAAARGLSIPSLAALSLTITMSSFVILALS